MQVLNQPHKKGRCACIHHQQQSDTWNYCWRPNKLLHMLQTNYRKSSNGVRQSIYYIKMVNWMLVYCNSGYGRDRQNLSSDSCSAHKITTRYGIRRDVSSDAKQHRWPPRGILGNQKKYFFGTSKLPNCRPLFIFHAQSIITILQSGKDILRLFVVLFFGVKCPFLIIKY
jgi:hypothetical protein